MAASVDPVSVRPLVAEKNSYFDNKRRVTSDVNEIQKNIKEIELVSEISGFHNKDGVISSQDIKEQPIRVQLPSQICPDRQRCLEKSWNDDLLVKSNLDKPHKKTEK